MVPPLNIQHCLKTSFVSQHMERFQTLVKSSWENLHQIFSSLWGEIIWKKSPWLKFEIIGLFVNTWTADYRYPVPDCETLAFPIQIQLSYKQKTFSGFSIPFVKSPSNSEIFQKKNLVIANVFPKFATVEGLVTSFTIQCRVKTCFASQHVKRFQTLAKSSWEHFYPTFPLL